VAARCGSGDDTKQRRRRAASVTAGGCGGGMVWRQRCEKNDGDDRSRFEGKVVQFFRQNGVVLDIVWLLFGC